jgi:hypothetical protein
MAETGRTERTEGVVWVIPSEIDSGSSRGEQNTLRRSNIEVGEGKPVSANQDDLLPIHTESPEGETEILSKTAFNDLRNVECSGSSLLSEAASGGPRLASFNSCDIIQSRVAPPA